jgi:hypothetical protein
MLKKLLKIFFPSFFTEPEKPKVAPTIVPKTVVAKTPKKRGRPKGSKNKPKK